MYARRNFWFQVLDALGEPITSGLKITLLAADGAAAAVYAGESGSTEVGSTGVISSTTFDALTPAGIVSFWTPLTSIDVEIVSEEGAHLKVEGLTGADHRIVLDVHRADVQLAYANSAVSTSVENTTAATTFDKNVTLSGENLKAGDVIEIDALVWVEDQNSTDTLTVILYVGTEAILTTSAVDVADNDLFHVHALVHVNTAGASGKLAAHGIYTFGVPGTAVPTPFRKGEASEDLSGDVAVKLTGTWSVAHADNECELHGLTVKVLHNGNV